MTDQRPRTLIIDDTPTNLLTLEAALASDYDGWMATSGETGLAWATESLPDLILLDVMMPGMDGYETCRRLKAAPQLRSIPVVFVTALTESSAESAGLALGAVDYITKPINIAVTKRRIHNVIEREELRREVDAHRNNLEALVKTRTAELRKMAVVLAETEERERSAIAQDLHDDLSQILAVTKLKVTSMRIPTESTWRHELIQDLKDIGALLDQANLSVRSLSLQLSPPVLYESGLVAALKWLAEQMQKSHGLEVRIHDEGEHFVLGEALSSSLFRTARELLINVAKHAQVSEAEVSIMTSGDMLHITVADEGVGFVLNGKPLPSATGGYGLFTVRERLQSIGGEIEIDTRFGDGTTIMLTVPMRVALPCASSTSHLEHIAIVS